jgi:hypothetical protein
MNSIDINLSMLPDDVSSYTDTAFYEFVEMYAGEIESEIFEVQCIRNVRTLLRVPDALSFFDLHCKETGDLKRRACFVADDGQYIFKAGIRFNIEQFIDLLRKHSVSTLSRGDNALAYASEAASNTADSRHSSGNLVDLRAKTEEIRSTSLVYAFIDNLLKNANRSSTHYEYSEAVEKFASALFILAGNHTYEFIRINLPGALPSTTTIEKRNRVINSRMTECEFHFDALHSYVRSIDSACVFAVSVGSKCFSRESLV